MLRSIKSVLHQSGFFDTHTLNVPGNSKVALPDRNFFFFFCAVKVWDQGKGPLISFVITVKSSWEIKKNKFSAVEKMLE